MSDKDEQAAHLEAVLDVHEELGKCMRDFCKEKRWVHPEKGELVLCKEHVEEVFRGEAKAPPLRRGFDYQSVGRKTFLVEMLPDDLKEKP